MHKWRIHDRTYWLCDCCLRDLADTIVTSRWRWLDFKKHPALCCDRCKCTDHTAARFGRWRHLVRWLSLLPALGLGLRCQGRRTHP